MNAIGVRHISLGAVVWILIGLVVAANHQLLSAGTIPGLLTAILAVLAWPLVLLGVQIGI